MHKMTFLAVSFSIFLLLATLGALFVTPATASPEIRRVPTPYPTIQAAINAANPGDIIEVASNTYYEHVVVNKSLKLIGESSSTTIIDGNGTGIVVRCSAPDVEIRGFTVQNGGVSPNSGGIMLLGSNSSIIVGNKIMNNSYAGIVIRDSSNNVIHNNLIANNSWGVWITSPSSLLNTFYHNNFINNLDHVNSFGTATKWDNGAEGNYWSDYVGVDANGDGIGDTGYPDPIFPMDKYPLMEPWSPYRVFLPYNVNTFSNSTLASFNFSQSLKQISFNATSGASGFCNVTIPKTLLNISIPEVRWKVIIDGRLLSTEERTVTENETHTSIYFTYTHGTHRVQITTRMSSTISIAFSSASITVGSNITISGSITAENLTGRPNVTVTIHYRLSGGVDWDTLATRKTDPNSNYNYLWTPDAAGTYEVMASWDGDDATFGNQSNVLTLAVKWTSTLLMALSSDSITLGDNVTISGNVTANDPTNPLRPNVNVMIQCKVSGAETWTWLANVTTDSDGIYSYVWTPDAAGTYEVMASWDGDDATFGNQSHMLTLTVQEAPAGIPLTVVVAAVVAIVIIAAAIVVYFVRFRKPGRK